MDALNVLRHVDTRSRERLKNTPAPVASARAELRDTLTDVARLSASTPATPATRAITDVVTNVQSYATSLSMFPSAAAGAMLQAVADVNELARLGQKPTLDPTEVRTAARSMLFDARDRAKTTKDANDQTAIVSQGLADARRTLSLTGDTAAEDIVPRFLDLCNAQTSPQNRATVMAAGAKVLSGVLTVRPQTVERGVRTSPLPGAALSLPPQRRAQFLDLWSRFQNVSVRVNRRFEGESFPVQDELRRLVDSGALDQKDSHGDDLLSNLHQLATQPMASGIDRDLILGQTIVHVANPGRSMSQGTKLTCAAATVSYQVARRRPSEYARLVCGLTWTQGQVRLASGAVARRVPGAMQEDGSGRSVVERLVQSALMDVGGSASHGAYDPLADGFFDGNKQMVQTGMFPAQFARLEEAVGEGRYKVVERPSATTVMDAIKASGDQTPVVLSWDHGEDHWVLARGVDNGRVYFRNPHGHRQTDKATLTGVDHQLHNNGVESLPVDVFLARTKTLLQRTP